MDHIGLIGVGIMGSNLALNLARNGYRVVLYDRDPQRTRCLIDRHPSENFIRVATLKALVDTLPKPRVLWLMINPGKPIDNLLRRLRFLIQAGDVIVDGGNSHYADSERRCHSLLKSKLDFLGIGVSGGAQGALFGPSIMVGGSFSAYQSISHILQDIAARAQDGTPCVAYLGSGGAGHYVKMVHNGIEYALMQAIAEAYDLLTCLAGFSADELADIFEGFQQCSLRSYLLEITTAILRRKDPEDGKPMIEKVLDVAEQKGTGTWASQEALQRGIPIPTITQAVEARFLSALKTKRTLAARLLSGPQPRWSNHQRLIEITQAALEASFLIAYAQGFALLSTAPHEHVYEIPLVEVARIWRAGCIIRSAILEDIYATLRADSQPTDLLLSEYYCERLGKLQEAWREVVSLGAMNGVPLPVMGSALAYYDSYRREQLPVNLIQAQRDCFGGHTFERVDRPGRYHLEW